RSGPMLSGAGGFLIGCGMGLLSVTSIAVVQDSVEWAKRGSATASLLFARTLGNTLGATAVGALLNSRIGPYGAGALAARVHTLLNQPTGLTQLANDAAVRAVFDQALRWSFGGLMTLAVLTFIATWLIPIEARVARDGEPRAPQVSLHLE